MPPENKLTMKRRKKGILTLWTRTLSSSLRGKYILLLGRFPFDSNSSSYQFVSNINYICYSTIDAQNLKEIMYTKLEWRANVDLSGKKR